MGVMFEANYSNLRVNTDNYCLDGFEWETVYNPSLLADVDAIKETVDVVTDVANTLTQEEDENETSNNVNVDFIIPDSPEITYDDSTGTLAIIDIDNNSQIIELSKDSEGNALFPATIIDSQGNSYNIAKESDGSIAITKNENKKTEEKTKEFAVFYKNIEFNPIDTLFVIKGFSKNINLTSQKQTNKQWSPVNAFWRVSDNASTTNANSFDIENIETANFYITVQQEIGATKDSVMLFVKYVDIDIEQEIIRTLSEIKNLDARFNNLVDSLDKALEDEGWDKPLIKGRNDKYVQRGMHDYFEEPTEPYEPCGFPIFDLFYQIYVTDVLIAKYDGKFNQLIEKIDSVMTPRNDGSYTVDNDFVQSVISQTAILHCTSTSDAIARYKLEIEDITIQNISPNE
jgi:hypothetical protein